MGGCGQPLDCRRLSADEAGELLGLAETIAGHGLFRAFFTDRGSQYFLSRRQSGLDSGYGAAGGCRHQRGNPCSACGSASGAMMSAAWASSRSNSAE